jgi:alpha-beta hydrolase superfamily lysophospholipase
MPVALKDELLDAQLLRTLGSASAGGADIGECLATAARIDGTDPNSWYQEWTSLAERVLAAAERDLADSHTVSARDGFLRAANYFRTAGVMLIGAPLDQRLVESNRRHTDVFRRGASLLPSPPEILAIPYETTTLPGYFFQSHTTHDPGPTVILTGGYDGSAEELYFLTGAAALARGYNVLAFDGPGQGAALLQQGLVLRPDWEHVIGPVVDYLSTRTNVDPARIALIGLSLGAHLAPRAASAEHRLAACIADCGSFDLFASALSRMPKPLRDGFEAGRPMATALLRRILGVLAAKPTAGWALRRGQLVHGVDSPTAYLRALRDYTLTGRAEQITCPTFVCHADADDIGDSAPQLAASLRCPHQLVTFTAAEGAGDHCEAGARSLYHARSFAWLDSVLRSTPPIQGTSQ